MTEQQFWLILWGMVFLTVILTSFFGMFRMRAYYKYESQRQIKLAEAGFNPNHGSQGGTDK